MWQFCFHERILRAVVSKDYLKNKTESGISSKKLIQNCELKRIQFMSSTCDRFLHFMLGLILIWISKGSTISNIKHYNKRFLSLLLIIHVESENAKWTSTPFFISNYYNIICSREIIVTHLKEQLHTNKMVYIFETKPAMAKPN